MPNLTVNIQWDTYMYVYMCTYTCKVGTVCAVYIYFPVCKEGYQTHTLELTQEKRNPGKIREIFRLSTLSLTYTVV